MPDDRDRRTLRKAPVSGEVVGRRPARRDEEFDEGPLQQDIERFDNPTRTCPECKKDVFDDSAVCYHCGHAFENTAAGSTKAKPWTVVVVVLIIAAFALVALRGLI
jgi:hypothetical protein